MDGSCVSEQRRLTDKPGSQACSVKWEAVSLSSQVGSGLSMTLGPPVRSQHCGWLAV